MADDPQTGSRPKPRFDPRAEPGEEELAEMAQAGTNRIAEPERLADAAAKRAAAQAASAEALLLRATVTHSKGAEEPPRSSRTDEIENARLALAEALGEKDALLARLAAAQDAMRAERETMDAERHAFRVEREEKEHTIEALLQANAAAVARSMRPPPPPTEEGAPAPRRTTNPPPVVAPLMESAPSPPAPTIARSVVPPRAPLADVASIVDPGGVGFAGALSETLGMAARVIPWKLVARGVVVMMLPAALYASRSDIKKESERLRNIPKVVITSQVTSDIASELQASTISTPLPPRREFASWVRKNYKGVPGTDPARDQWGTLFRLDVPPRRLGIRSAGPDKRFNTKDDIFRGVQDMGFNRM